MTVLSRFRRVALLEGTSFLVLLGIAMPLKYVWHLPMATKIVGAIHGFLFLWYVWAALEVKDAMGWSTRRYMMALVASVLPAGPFFFDRTLQNESPPQASGRGAGGE